MESQELKQQFEEQGFLHLENFFSDADAQELESALNRYVTEVAPGLPAGTVMYENREDPSSVKQLQHMDEFDPAFERLLQNPRLVTLAEALLGDKVVPQNVEAFIKPPLQGSPTPPHQDGYYFCLVPNEAVTFWLPVGDIDSENGALCYLVGSHRKGIMSHGTSGVLGFSQGLQESNLEAFGPEVVCSVKKGDALVHHSRTIHYAAGNSSPRPRRAVGVVYFAERAKIDEEAQQRYKDALQEQHKTLQVA